MKIKFTTLLSTALAVAVLSATSAIAQSGPFDAPADPISPEAGESPPLEPEAPPAAPEESISPESDPTQESESDIGGAEESSDLGGAEEIAEPTITSDGSNSLVSCGPNGAAFVVTNVSSGCRVLKVNSPPGQSTNAEAEAVE